MRQTQFSIIKEKLYSSDLGAYCSFGIVVCASALSRWEKVAQVSDVSPDSSFVLALADTCTRLQLDPCHLYDVVIDAIS